MKRFINILFLVISIMFSFGFTSYKSACDHNLIQTFEKNKNHDCCQKTTTKCHSSSGCEEDCCLEPNDMLQLNEFVAISEKVPELTLLKSIKQLVVFKTKYLVVQTNTIKPKNFEFLNKPNRAKVLSIKQSWVI